MNKVEFISLRVCYWLDKGSINEVSGVMDLLALIWMEAKGSSLLNIRIERFHQPSRFTRSQFRLCFYRGKVNRNVCMIRAVHLFYVHLFYVH